MKRFAVLFALFAIVTVASFAQTFDFTLVNNTGFTITEVYCSPSDSDEWENDVLGVDVLENKKSVKITFDPDYEEVLLAFDVDKYDLKVVYTNDAEHFFTDLKLAEINQLTLTLDKKGNSVATWK